MKPLGEPAEAAVVIGRFQPFHNGHLALVNRALLAGKWCVVIVGSSQESRTDRNPFTAGERIEMIAGALGEADRERLIVLPVPDLNDEPRWAQLVQREVLDALTERGVERPSIVLVGHFKDPSSDYLRAFPEWPLVHAEPVDDAQGSALHATDLRERYFDLPRAEALASFVGLMPSTTLDFLRRWQNTSVPDLLDMPTDFDRVLAVVAHPDDLEYGASAAVAMWTDAGKTVSYLLISRGEAGIDGIEPSECGRLRAAEQVAAAACVGVDTVEFLDHRDGTIENTVALRRDIAGAIRRHRPQLIVTLNHEDTWFGVRWNSPDHRNTGRAVLDAVGDAGNRWIHPEQIGGMVEPWDGVRWVAISGAANPTHAMAIEPGLERAIASLEAHATYLEALGGPMADARSFLTGMAQATGERFGGRLATSFKLFGEV